MHPSCLCQDLPSKYNIGRGRAQAQMVSANWGPWWGNQGRGHHNLCSSVWEVKDEAKHCLVPWGTVPEHECRVTHQLCCAASCPSTGAVQVTTTDLCFVDKFWKWRGRRELVQLGAPHSFTSSMQASCCVLTSAHWTKRVPKKRAHYLFMCL